MTSPAGSASATATSEQDVAAQALERRVRTTWRSVSAVRATESLLLAVSAGVIGLAAAVASGAGLLSLSAWVGAGLCALACGATWWIEHRLSVTDAARRMDVRLEAGGALLTAWEVARRPTTSPVAALLVARVRERHLAQTTRRRVMPESLPLTALPFLAVALLAAVLQRTRDPQDAVPIASLVAGLSDELGDLRGSLLAGDLPDVAQEDAQRLMDLSSKATSLALDLEDGSPADAEETERLEELEAEMAALMRSLDPEAAERLARARNWADSARRAAAEASGTDPSSEAGESSSGEEVAQGAADGTMSGHPDSGLGTESRPPAAAAGDPEAAGAGEPAVEVGVNAGRWWSPRHDAVVERWIAQR